MDSIDELVASFSNDKFAFYSKLDKLKIDDKNMFAWSSIARFDAKKQKIKTFNFR